MPQSESFALLQVRYGIFHQTWQKLVDGICSTEAIIEKLVDEISKSHDLVAKQQEQMDRVLTMLESERTDKGELEKILKKKYEGSLK